MKVQVQIAKANKAIEVDFSALPQASQEYIIAYGLKQRLNDVHSQVKSTEEGAPELVMALVEKAIAGLESGDIRTSGGGKAGFSGFDAHMAVQLRKALKLKSNAALAEALEAKGVSLEETFGKLCERLGTTLAAERKAFDKAQRKAVKASLEDLLA